MSNNLKLHIYSQICNEVAKQKYIQLSVEGKEPMLSTNNKVMISIEVEPGVEIFVNQENGYKRPLSDLDFNELGLVSRRISKIQRQKDSESLPVTRKDQVFIF